MTQEKDRIGEYLIKSGVITEEQLRQALEAQKKTGKLLGEILVEKDFVSEEKVSKALAVQFDLEQVQLRSCTIDSSLTLMFPSDKMRQWRIFPVKLEGNSLTVAVVNPLDIKVLQRLKYLSGYRIIPVLSTPREIDTCINKYFGPLQHFNEAVQEIVTSTQGGNEEMPLKDLEVAAKEVPIVRLVSSILSEAIKQEASDIHFEPQKDSLRVRFRLDGILYERFSIPKGLQPPVISRIKITSGIDIAERRRPQDGRINILAGNKEYDIRVSTLPDLHGEKVVLRILDKQSIRTDLQTVGLNDNELATVFDLIKHPYGMILITGPTGSGKSTTLYSILNKLNDTTRNIVTVEDPIEYALAGINQTAVNVRAGYTFATGMRHILRQDPDIIMIGEIRDLETAEIAIQAALTGHLVLSTLHTNSAPGAILRLLDMGVEPFLISSSVVGVIAQRLVRVLCQHCAQECEISAELLKDISDYLPEAKSLQFLKPTGCKKCRDTGYRRRSGIFEIMRVTSEIKNLILKRAMEKEIAEMAIKQGMCTLQISGLAKAGKKITSLEETMRVAFVKK